MVKQVPVQVNFLGHCVFCLRKTKRTAGAAVNFTSTTKDSTELLHVVPKAEVSPSSPSLLNTFNRIWLPLQKKKIEENGEEEDPFGFLDTATAGGSKANKSSVFACLPGLCKFCAEKLRTVDKLMRDLLAEMNGLREIIQESKYGGRYSWRASEFEATLANSTMEAGSIRATLKFLDNLGKNAREVDPVDNIIKTDEDSVPDHCSVTSGNEDDDNHPSRMDIDLNMDEQEIPCVTNKVSAPTAAADPLELPENGIEASVNSRFDTEDAPSSISDYDGGSDPDYVKSEEETDSSSDSEEDKMASQDANFKTITHQDQTTNKKKRAPSGKGINYAKELDPETGKVKYTCLINGCGKTYLTVLHNKTPSALLEHQKAFHELHGDPTLVCDLCSKKFRGRKALRDHKRTKHGIFTKLPQNSDSKFNTECDLCRENVPSKDLYKHLRAHVGDEYVIKCPNGKCSFACISERLLKQHLQRSPTCVVSTPDMQQFIASTHTCEVCGFTTGHAFQLRRHLLNDHETSDKKFQCPIHGCQMQFTVKQSVVYHLHHHDLSAKITNQMCPHCSCKYEIGAMEEHLKEKHNAKDIIKCHQCPQLFSSREQLVDHLFTHRYGDLTCDICGDEVKFHRHSKLRDHYFHVHKVGVQYSCQQCGSVFLAEKGLKEHEIKLHSEAQLKKKTEREPKKAEFMCQECGVTFKGENALRNHNIKNHGADPYSCVFCSETFTSKESKLKHERSHRGIDYPDPEFKCDVDGCGKVFKKKILMQQHIKFTHLKLKEHVCETCGKAYTTKQMLQNHTDTVHLGLRPHICDICGESFGHREVLKCHKLIHTGERPFACEICGQRFRHSVAMTRHLEAHKKKGNNFKPTGPMKQIRKRVERK